MNKPARPPRWADATLRCLVKPGDRDAISGDLLEEYRAVRRPALGPVGADVWYIAQVGSILWQLIGVGASIVAAQSVMLALTVFRPGHHAPPSPDAVSVMRSMPWLALSVRAVWFGSVLPAPGLSALDALIYAGVACYAATRSGLARTGIVSAAATSVAGSVVLFAAAACITPGLVAAVFEHPALLLILSVYVLVPLLYSVAWGVVGGLAGRTIATRTPRVHTRRSA